MKFETEKFRQTKLPLAELSLRSKNFYEFIKILRQKNIKIVFDLNIRLNRWSNKLQLNKTGNLNHLLTTEGLKEDLIFKIFNLFSRFLFIQLVIRN